MKHRLFLAIDLPPFHKSEIEKLQKQLDGFGLPITWEIPEKLHLTLHFIGATPAEQEMDLISSVRPITSIFPSFPLTLYFLETMYRKHEPSFVYLAPGADLSQLKSLQSQLGDLLHSRRLSFQDRFFPHVLIGKLKRTDPVATKKFLGQISDFEFSPLPSFAVDHVTLYQSFLSRNGSSFRQVNQFPLAI